MSVLDMTATNRSLRLGIDLLGGGLFVVGVFFAWWYPEQAQIGALVQALAALLVGMASLVRGIHGMMHGRVEQSTDQLVAIAILAAAASGDFLTAVSLPLLLDMVRIFEERTVLGAQEAIDSLLELSSPPMIRMQDGAESTCSVQDIAVGDVILVRAGMRVGVDAEVVSGWSLVDTSAVTGELQAQEVQEGSVIYAGSQNISSDIVLRVRAIGKDSAIGRVIAILEEALDTPQVQAIEQWIGIYMPIALCIAGTVLFVTEDLTRVIALLVALCPTALAISGPSTMVCALNAAAKKGVLIKGRNALALLPTCTTLAIDKTGTLTKGVLEVQEYTCSQEDFFCAAGIAQSSLHPISKALLEHARSLGFGHVSISAQEYRGEGLEAQIDGKKYLLGRASFLQRHGVPIPEEQLHREGIVTYFACEQEFLGVVSFVDTLRAEAEEMLCALEEEGFLRFLMLTGDQQAEALRVASSLSFTEVHAELLPEAKAQLVQAEQSPVLMVGDGINDALALHSASVGVAFGRDLSQAVLGGADVAIQDHSLSMIPWLVSLAKRTEKILYRNIILSIVVGMMFAVCTALGLFSVLDVALAQLVLALLVTAQSASLLGGLVSEEESEDFSL